MCTIQEKNISGKVKILAKKEIFHFRENGKRPVRFNSKTKLLKKLCDTDH
jgi:hypothetical protein